MSDPSTAAPSDPANGRRRLGTFGGVFTPSILTILGLVMFIRFGYVTGNAGLDKTIIIVLLANVVSILTSLSLAVIASNTRVKGGGDYFLISRSLGLESGGAIGTVLYVAQSVSVAFYVVGFTEALDQVVGGLGMPTQLLGIPTPEFALQNPAELVSTGVCLLLFLLAYRGADLATRFQYVIMAGLVLALASYFGGAYLAFDPALMEQNRGAAPGGMPFWVVFAIFFPAITGFTQGVSMSGDLKEPEKSLPRGTFMAVGLSLVVYLVLPVVLSGSSTREELVTDIGALTMKRSALIPELVDVGVFAATLSSALASMMGAPRILRAMGMDRLFPGAAWFAMGGNADGEPRRAMWVTFWIAVVCIWAGDLNAIARVVTMFFLLSYGAMNWATFVEGFSNAPGFRPRFRFGGWRTALLGAFVCGGVMLAIDALATLVAAFLLFLIRSYLSGRKLDQPAGDARRGFYVQRIKDYLLRLAERPRHSRSWRPQVVAVTWTGEKQRQLARFADTIGSRYGMLTLATVLVGPFEDLVEERQRRIDALQRLARQERLQYFHEVTIARSRLEGIRSLLMTYGIGQLRPNTLLLPWSPDIDAEYVELLATAAALQSNVVLLNPVAGGAFDDAEEESRTEPERIDIWWRGRRNGTLALLLAHIVRLHHDWRKSVIRLLRIAPVEAVREEATAELEELADNSRIDAEVGVIVDSRSPFTVISETSAGSRLVFLGVGGVRGGERVDLSRYNIVLDKLPTTALVFASTPLDVEA